MMNGSKVAIAAAAILAVATVVVLLSSEPSSPDHIAARDRAVHWTTELFTGKSREGCMRTRVDKSVRAINKTPWKAGSFNVTSTEYAEGIMAGSYGACPIEVKGMAAEDSEAICQGHYWFAGDDLRTNTVDVARDSLFVQYYSAAFNAFRYDEIFVYDSEYDTKVSGIEMFETSNMIAGTFGNINLAPGINSNTLETSPLDGGTVQATAPGSCITRGGCVLPSSHDLVDPEVGTYLGVVKFPKGFMLVGELFDAYAVKNRWPVPGAVIIMYVDRTPGSPNHGYCTTWIIFQEENGKPGKNYWWDFSKILKGGSVARNKFELDPDYYFKIPKPLVDTCDSPGATVVLPIPPLGNMSKAWLPDAYGPPGWATPHTKASRG